MKISILKRFILSSLAFTLLTFSSCKKDKSEPQEPTAVRIGNKDYAIVKMGTQTWTAENYSGEGGVYYQVNGVNKVEYGKYYTLAEANAIVVPAGWRLPTKEDVKKLLELQGADLDVKGSQTFTGELSVVKKLLSITGWPRSIGTNGSGFNAFPAGYTNPEGSFASQGTYAYFWTSSTATTNNLPVYFLLNMDDSEDEAMAAYVVSNSLLDGYRLSIRFVKDN